LLDTDLLAMNPCHVTAEMELARAELDRLADTLSFSADYWNCRAAGHQAALSRWYLLWRQAYGADRAVTDPPVVCDVIAGGHFQLTT
jgi:hypothetical protein